MSNNHLMGGQTLPDGSGLARALGLPGVSQVGIVVRDAQKSADFYSAKLGLGPFTLYEFAPDKHWYREQPSPLRLKMAKAMWGPVEMEFIQPLAGRSIHQEFLEEHGEGLQHLGFLVEDYEASFNRLVQAGFEPMMRAESYVPSYDGLLKACYFDTRRIGGVICEIIWRSWSVGEGGQR